MFRLFFFARQQPIPTLLAERGNTRVDESGIWESSRMKSSPFNAELGFIMYSIFNRGKLFFHPSPFRLSTLLISIIVSNPFFFVLQANHTEDVFLPSSTQIKIWPINQLWGKGVSKSLQVSCFTVGYKKVGTWERGALKSRKKRGVGERRHRRLHLSAARSHRKPT